MQLKLLRIKHTQIFKKIALQISAVDQQEAGRSKGKVFSHVSVSRKGVVMPSRKFKQEVKKPAA